MRDQAVGLPAGADAGSWARRLAQAHRVALDTGRAPVAVRELITASWTRCVAAGVDPHRTGAPLLLDPRDASARWREHPLAECSELMLGVLGDLLYDARHIVVVSDERGCLLWSAGHPAVLRASERIRFYPGHAWDEAHTGTNAAGTALACGRALQVFAAEHFREEVHTWQCSAAPVRDPESERILGVIDVTGGYRTAQPHNLALVAVAARLVEERLRSRMLAAEAKVLARFAEHTARHGGPAAAVSASGRVLAATPAGWLQGRVRLCADGSVLALRADGSAARPPAGDLAALEHHELGAGALVLPTACPPRARRAPDRRPRLRLLGAAGAGPTARRQRAADGPAERAGGAVGTAPGGA
jgi:transcriptional regulator of acetoin/glycerol metabolism